MLDATLLRKYKPEQIMLAEALLCVYRSARILQLMDESGHHEWEGLSREEVQEALWGLLADVLGITPGDPEADQAIYGFVEFQVNSLATMRYDEYLRTPEWKDVRRFALKRAGDRCQTCNRSGPFHVHHRTYERRGRESLADVLVLCADCHKAFHETRTLAGR
jgi:HNH endonuclease